MSDLTLSVDPKARRFGKAAAKRDVLPSDVTDRPIPDTKKELTAALGNVVEMVHRGGWWTAAAVYAWTEPSAGNGQRARSNVSGLSIGDFARLGIRGLGSRNTVAKFRSAWELAIAAGWAQAVRPGDVVRIPTQDFVLVSKDRQARAISPGGTDSPAARWQILTGTFQERLAEFPAGSVDLILTDPPYPDEFAPLWDDLAVHAKRVLRPGGIVAAMSGKIHVDDRMRRLGACLAYGWIYAQPLPGSNTRILARHVLQEWKPWLCYSNGPWPSGQIDWNGDLLDAGPRNKDDYHWQQQLEPAVQLVERLSRPNDLVVDPFCGSGTSGVAALQAGRRFIGIEADGGRVAAATARLQGLS